MIQKFDDCHCLCSTKIDRAPGTRERVIRCERSGSRRRWSWCWPWALGLLVGSSIDVQGLVGSKAKPAIKRATRAADRTIFFTMVSPSEGGVCHEWIVEIGAIILQVSAVQTIGDVAGNLYPRTIVYFHTPHKMMHILSGRSRRPLDTVIRSRGNLMPINSAEGTVRRANSD